MNKNSLKNISKVINSGLTPLRSNSDYWIDGNIPWVKTEQLGVKYIYNSNEKITKNALENTSIKLNPANTLSIAMYGEGKTRGSVSILKNETTTNQACCNIVIDEEKADFEFVYYNLKTQYKNLRNLSSGVRKNLNSNDIKNFEIYLPNLDSQKQITKVLSDLDSKIELNNKINQELEAMAKTLYDYWFVQFDFPDKNEKPYKSSGGKMVFNEELKREIPEGWEVKYLTEEMDLQYGFPFSTKLFNFEENGVPVIRIRDILKCSISNYSTEEVDEKYKLFKGDILVGMDGNFHINYWNKEGCYLNQRSLRIRSNKNSISEIQTKYSIEPYIKAREKNVSRTTVAHLSAKDVNDLKVLKATNELQLKANKFFVTTLDKIVSNREQNQKLSELRDWLLPMLMNGQVSVIEAEKEVEDLHIAAEPVTTYNKEENSLLDIFEAINYDYEVATIVWLTEQKLKKSFGKKYIHKMFSNIEFLNTLPVIKELQFQEHGWGMFSPAIAKTIENKKFIKFENVGINQSVLKLNYKHLSTVGKWIKKEENLDFVNQVNDMLSVYEDSLIDKNMDRIELLNTVLECIKVLNSYDFENIYHKMKNWKMIEDGYKTKVDKFKLGETKLIIELIKELKKDNN